MAGGSDEAADVTPREPQGAAPAPEGKVTPPVDKAEPEKAKTEIEAGDVADDLADFA